MTDDWQPIASAPRDGTQILAHTGRNCVVVEYCVWADGTSFWEMGHRSDGKILTVGSRLLGWMPLPPLPKPVSEP